MIKTKTSKKGINIRIVGDTGDLFQELGLIIRDCKRVFEEEFGEELAQMFMVQILKFAYAIDEEAENKVLDETARLFNEKVEGVTMKIKDRG